MEEPKTFDRLSTIVAGVLAGGLAKTPEEAVRLAYDCYDLMLKEPRRRKEATVDND